jgi:antibiotic biosynthesis monooxygenase (ABM) superfamily enzyme
MSQEIHVTSTCISDIQRNLTEKLIPALRGLRKDVDTTGVDFPGFGTLGILMIGQYGTVQEDVRNAVDDSIDTVEAWIKSLDIIRKNWVEAENNSTVVYR